MLKNRFPIEFKEYEYFTNDEKTRSFLSMRVTNGKLQVLINFLFSISLFNISLLIFILIYCFIFSLLMIKF